MGLDRTLCEHLMSPLTWLRIPSVPSGQAMFEPGGLAEDSTGSHSDCVPKETCAPFEPATFAMTWLTAPATCRLWASV